MNRILKVPNRKKKNKKVKNTRNKKKRVENSPVVGE